MCVPLWGNRSDTMTLHSCESLSWLPRQVKKNACTLIGLDILLHLAMNKRMISWEKEYAIFKSKAVHYGISFPEACCHINKTTSVQLLHFEFHTKEDAASKISQHDAFCFMLHTVSGSVRPASKELRNRQVCYNLPHVGHVYCAVKKNSDNSAYICVDGHSWKDGTYTFTVQDMLSQIVDFDIFEMVVVEQQPCKQEAV